MDRVVHGSFPPVEPTGPEDSRVLSTRPRRTRKRHLTSGTTVVVPEPCGDEDCVRVLFPTTGHHSTSTRVGSGPPAHEVPSEGSSPPRTRPRPPSSRPTGVPFIQQGRQRSCLLVLFVVHVSSTTWPLSCFVGALPPTPIPSFSPTVPLPLRDEGGPRRHRGRHRQVSSTVHTGTPDSEEVRNQRSRYISPVSTGEGWVGHQFYGTPWTVSRPGSLKKRDQECLWGPGALNTTPGLFRDSLPQPSPGVQRRKFGTRGSLLGGRRYHRKGRPGPNEVSRLRLIPYRQSSLGV